MREERKSLMFVLLKMVLVFVLNCVFSFSNVAHQKEFAYKAYCVYNRKCSVSFSVAVISLTTNRVVVVTNFYEHYLNL